MHGESQLLYFPIAYGHVGLSIYRELAHEGIQTVALLIGEYEARGIVLHSAYTVLTLFVICFASQPVGLYPSAQRGVAHDTNSRLDDITGDKECHNRV